MEAVRKMLMLYIVKLLAPESPAYGNALPFVKEEGLEEIVSGLEVGDIIFTKTNNSWYQLSRRLLNTEYDHVSVVISKTEVIHISPPIISKLELNRIMQKSRQPIVYRLSLNKQNKENLLSILMHFLGEKYNQTAIPSMIKNQVASRLLKTQHDHLFTFQNLKYSKICTEAILYALCKSISALQQNIERFVREKTGYKKLGYIMPDQMISFLEENDAKVVYKAPTNTQKTLVDLVEDSMQIVSEKLSFVTEFADNKILTGRQAVAVVTKIIKESKKYFLKNHPLIKIASFVVFLYEIKYGSKFNKILLLYSTVATLMLMRVMPDEIISKNIMERLPKL